jgi:hypothetical protein
MPAGDRATAHSYVLITGAQCRYCVPLVKMVALPSLARAMADGCGELDVSDWRAELLELQCRADVLKFPPGWRLAGALLAARVHAAAVVRGARVRVRVELREVLA